MTMMVRRYCEVITRTSISEGLVLIVRGRGKRWGEEVGGIGGGDKEGLVKLDWIDKVLLVMYMGDWVAFLRSGRWEFYV